MLRDWAATINLTLVCLTALAALGMFRGSVRSVAERRKYFAFTLKLPFNIQWRFAGGEDAAQVNRIVDSDGVATQSTTAMAELVPASINAELQSSRSADFKPETPSAREPG